MTRFGNEEPIPDEGISGVGIGYVGMAIDFEISSEVLNLV